MPTRIDGSIFYSCTDVAQTCAVSRQTIWRWRHYGLIPSGRAGRARSVVFTKSEVDLIRAHATQLDSSRESRSQVVYLDNAASTRPLAIVRNAIMRAMDLNFGNPSSAHSSGRQARQLVEDARDQVAALVGAERTHVSFTSGATEANNWVLQGAVKSGVHRIITTAIEHSSVLGPVGALKQTGIDVIVLPVDRTGVIDLQSLKMLPIDERTLVSLQWANNETGVIQPTLQAAAIVKARGGLFHSDASQAAGKLLLSFAESPLDALTITAHKLHGPQGVGAALLKPSFAPTPLLVGGSQEHGLRVGTENYPGIIGFGVAAEHRLATLRSFVQKAHSLRGVIESRLLGAFIDVEVNGGTANRVCTTGNIRIGRIDGQALVAQLDARNVRVSQSSACTNMRPEPSYVLRAMGLTEEESYASIRYAVSEDSTYETCDRATDLMIEIATRLGAVRRTPAASHSRLEVA